MSGGRAVWKYVDGDCRINLQVRETQGLPRLGWIYFWIVAIEDGAVQKAQSLKFMIMFTMVICCNLLQKFIVLYQRENK